MKSSFLSSFTPSLMAPDTLEALFVKREPIVQGLTDHIRDSALTQAKHHTVLIGSRGIGKTHLVALVYNRIKAMEDLTGHLRIAWLREEEWGVGSFLDLLIRIFRSLESDYPGELPSDQIEAIYDLDPAHAEVVAGCLLKEFMGDRALLILIENLDDVFKGMEITGQQKLRAYLQENPFCTILATSQKLFNGISRQTYPFYGFFRAVHLTDFALDDAIALFVNIANFKGDARLASFLKSPTGRARTRAIRHLAGGNPRVYVILSQFLTRESMDDLVEPFLCMLDELTPYYQARLSFLSSQQRKIVGFLCDTGAAVPVKEIAKRTFITQQTLSSQLKDLREKGYVHSDPLGPTGRDTYYELCEPLMRMCVEVKKNRGGPIRLFIEFLQLWYTEDELRLMAARKSVPEMERDYILRAIRAAEESIEDPRIRACTEDLLAYIANGETIRALEITEELIYLRGSLEDWLQSAILLYGLKRYEEAITSCNKAIIIDASDKYTWYLHGVIFHTMHRYEEAVAAFDASLKIDPGFLNGWLQRGRTLSCLGLQEQGIASCDKAIELDPTSKSAFYWRGALLLAKQNATLALSSFNTAIRIEPNYAEAWFGRGSALEIMQNIGDSLTAFDRAIEIDPQMSEAWLFRGRILIDNQRYHEAWSSYKKAISAAINRNERQAILDVLVAAIRSLRSTGADTKIVQDSLADWQTILIGRSEFTIPFRMLTTAVQYLQTNDKRILLELPAEQRTALLEYLGLEGLEE